MPKSVFRIFTFPEFTDFLQRTTFQRKITVIQNHHTLKPDYDDFKRNGDHLAHLENMRTFHLRVRKWNDIGQNLTIFPDGMIGLCRSIDSMPAGIFGANPGAICIESLGNFDVGKDQMTAAQKEAIVKTNAALCVKFGLNPFPHQVVYHHWYDTTGKRFAPSAIDTGKVLRDQLQKTCPGTNFFCTPGSQGNTIQSATANFYPLIRAEMNSLQQTPAPPIQPILKRVKADNLRVRSGPGIAFKVVRQLPKGLQIQVFDTQDRWSRISPGTEEWVSIDFLI